MARFLHYAWLNFCLLFCSQQISGHNWTSNCDVSTTGWRRKFQSLANYRISSGVGLKWSWTTAKTSTSSPRVCRPATRSKSKSKLNPIGHQPPFSLSSAAHLSRIWISRNRLVCKTWRTDKKAIVCFPLKPKQELVMNRLLPYNNTRPRLVVHLVHSLKGIFLSEGKRNCFLFQRFSEKILTTWTTKMDQTLFFSPCLLMDYAGKFRSRETRGGKKKLRNDNSQDIPFHPVFKVSGPLTFVNYIHSGQNRL